MAMSRTFLHLSKYEYIDTFVAVNKHVDPHIASVGFFIWYNTTINTKFPL